MAASLFAFLGMLASSGPVELSVVGLGISGDIAFGVVVGLVVEVLGWARVGVTLTVQGVYMHSLNSSM